MVFFPFVFLLSLFSTIFSVTGNKACADFNYGASVATLAGLEDVFICPADGYSRTVCNETFPVRGVDDVTQSTMTLGDIVFYILVVRSFYRIYALFFIFLCNFFHSPKR